MKRIFTFFLTALFLMAFTGCTPPQSQSGTESPFFEEMTPRDAELNLEIIDGKFRFQRIATNPYIVYSDTPITDMTQGTLYKDRHDILTTIFRATEGKEAIIDSPECDFTHYIYMFDGTSENIPWHYRFAIHDRGTVMITNNDELLCTVEISEEELQTILNAFR